jgi:hypothetical protein
MDVPDQPRRSNRRGCFVTALVLIVTFVAAVVGWWKWSFPYGHSHSCSKGLGVTLRIFANDHEGWYPYGGRTPEESLSLICTNGDPYHLKSLLRGKHLPQSVVDDALNRHGVLSPESCGWHYVEGLREDDNPNLAVAWDRVTGLDHNGRRRSDLQHEILRLDGSSGFISKGRWSAFIEEQQMLIAETIAKRPSNSPAIRWSDETSLGTNKFPSTKTSKLK